MCFALIETQMIAKNCPKCNQQVPVACKACPCGHSFFNSRRTTRALSPSSDIRRRTQRVRREKPNYYDSLEYDKQIRKNKTRNIEYENDEEKKEKMKRKKIKKEEDDDEEIVTSMTPEKQLRFSLILEEINRKIVSVSWKPL